MLGIIIAHKSLADSLIQTVQAILGHHEDLVAFSNEKITTEEAMNRLQEIISAAGEPGEVLFMADLRGGNCWTIARLFTRNKSNYFVISGVNLPMVLSFLTKKNQLSATDLVEAVEKDGHRGILLERSG